jgi:diguanylate cyclase (GGDEF)-like protein
LLGTQRSDHHHAMTLLNEIVERHVLMLNARLHEYHDGEMQQVHGLAMDSGQQLNTFSNWVVIFSLVAVLIVVVSFWINNSVLIRPIVSLSRTTSQFATGDLKQKVPVYSRDELGNLAANINRMAESLDALYEQMSRLAKTDQLTGLINRHGYEEIVAREMSSAKRYGRPLSMAIVDIDHFKRINDTYGHVVGDKVLKAVAETALKLLRECDYCFRFGGEEFVALMPQTSLDAAMAALERLRQGIEASEFYLYGHNVKLTVSAGVVSYTGGDERQERLLQEADQAMYAAKEGGRNRVVSFPIPPATRGKEQEL